MIRINFVGDVALFKEYQEKEIDPFRSIHLPESDYNIGNFEFIIPNQGEKNFFDVSENYKVDYDYFKTLCLEKFNAFGLANNHCMDYGTEGLNDVQRVLHGKGIKTFGIGTGNFNRLDFVIKDVSFSILSFVKKGRWTRKPNELGPDDYRADEIIKEIQKIKTEVDHVIIYPHWGTELVDIPDPNDVEAARSFIDAGASAVIGHHPHIIQGVETYKNGFVAYSLGSYIYVPKFEVGYSEKQDKKRNLSLCVTLTFSKSQVEHFNSAVYDLDERKLVPKLSKDLEHKEYLTQLSGLIGNKEAYKRKILRVLIRREVLSFLQRFRKQPLKTIRHYSKYLSIRHFKKIL